MKTSWPCTVVCTAILITTSFTLGGLLDSSGLDLLPPPARDAFTAAFPDAKVREVKQERQVVKLYEITAVTPEGEREITITPDGVVLDVEYEIDPANVPASVKESLSAMGDKVKVIELEVIEVRAELMPVKLETPRTEYEAEIALNKSERLVRLSEQGQPVGGASDAPEEGDEDED